MPEIRILLRLKPHTPAVELSLDEAKGLLKFLQGILQEAPTVHERIVERVRDPWPWYWRAGGYWDKWYSNPWTYTTFSSTTGGALSFQGTSSLGSGTPRSGYMAVLEPPKSTPDAP